MWISQLCDICLPSCYEILKKQNSSSKRIMPPFNNGSTNDSFVYLNQIIPSALRFGKFVGKK